MAVRLTCRCTSCRSPTGGSTVKRFSFGNPDKTGKRSKTILLMGATDSGKTTMINAMINYILGVEWQDQLRFMLIDEVGPWRVSGPQSNE